MISNMNATVDISHEDFKFLDRYYNSTLEFLKYLSRRGYRIRYSLRNSSRGESLCGKVEYFSCRKAADGSLLIYGIVAVEDVLAVLNKYGL